MWRAWDQRLGVYCAAKLLRRRDAGQLLRFVREQAVRLDGEHLASPYAWAAEDAEVLIASELVGGGSLHTLLGDYGPLAEGTVVALLEQVLDALSDVHAAGLIHRDVKSGNVLLRATGTGPLNALLTDFGLAIGERDARFTEMGAVIGTPGYLAPEILAGSAELTAAQDLYAAGRLAVALLTGSEPRVGVDVIPVIRNRELAAVVASLLAGDPVDRPESAAIARQTVARIGRDRLPHTVDGDEVDVLRQLPELPAGWDPETGPNSAVPRHAHHDRARHVGAQAPSLDSGHPAGNPADTVAITMVDASPAGPVPTEIGQRPAAAPVASPTTGQPTSRRLWAWTVLAAVVVGFAVYFIAAAAAAARPGPQQPPASPTGTPGRSGSVSRESSAASVSGTEVSRDENPVAATTSAAEGVASPTAGQECSFQQENSSAVDPGGRPLQCQLTDGGYRWSVEATR